MKIVHKGLLLIFGFVAINASAKSINEFDYIGVSYLDLTYDDLTFHKKISQPEADGLVSTANTSLSGYRVFIGHHFNQYFAAELGLSLYETAALELTQQTVNSGVTTSTEVESGEFKSLSADIRAIATFPITSNVYLKAHLGASFWDNSFTYLTFENAQYGTRTQYETDVSLSSGFGLGYALSKTVALTLDFEKTEIAGVTTETLAFTGLMRF